MLLAIAMMVGMLPGTVFATENAPTLEINGNTAHIQIPNGADVKEVEGLVTQVLQTGVTTLDVTVKDPDYLESVRNALAAAEVDDGSITLRLSGVTEIPEEAFYNTLQLGTIHIPASVTVIGGYAFDGCENLTTVTFEEGSQLTGIGEKAFWCCSGLESIVIPRNVSTIGLCAFALCENLEEVVFEEGSQLNRIEQEAFAHNAFTSITLPASIKYIGDYAFYRAEDGTLDSLTVLAADPPAIEYQSMDGVDKIYVLEGSVEAYKAAERWDRYARAIQACACPHSYQFTANGDNHLMVCTVCGAQVPESHEEFTYFAKDNTIYHGCTKCGQSDGSLSLTMESWTYDGEKHYQQITGTGIMYPANSVDYDVECTRNGEILDGLPVDAGEYEISVIYGGAKATVPFTIAKRELKITSLGISKDYDGTNTVTFSGVYFDEVRNDDVYYPVDIDLTCTLEGTEPGVDYTKVYNLHLSWDDVLGEDKDNYYFNPSPDGTYVLEYGYWISAVPLRIIPKIQYGTSLKQDEYTVKGLLEGHKVTGVRLYMGEDGYDDDVIYVDAEAVKIVDAEGKDMTAYYSISTETAYLYVAHEGHTFNKDGFCATGECSLYEPADLGYDEWGSSIYEIANAGQLFWYGEYVNKGNSGTKAVLVSDIQVPAGDYNWVPINGVDQWVTFDGCGYTISGLRSVWPEEERVGFFSDNGYATIDNLTLANCYFEGLSYVGGIAGYVGSAISNCAVVNTTVKAAEGRSQVGSFAGYVGGGQVYNCYTNGSSFTSHISSGYGSAENCYFLSDTEDTLDGTTAVTAAQLASGEIAWLLQGEQDVHIWGQTIGEDLYPVVGGQKVYYGYLDCNEVNPMGYSNGTVYEEVPPHTGEIQYVQKDGKHTGVYDCCGTVAMTEEACTGGTATCMGYLCEVCSNWYGEKIGHEMDASTGFCRFGCETFMAQAKVGEGYYLTFSEALKNWADGTTLTLMADAVHSEAITILDKSVTLDLNGHTLTLNDPDNLDEYNMLVELTVGTEANPSGKLTIQDSGQNGELVSSGMIKVYGEMDLLSGTLAVVDGLLFVNIYGEMDMTGGTVCARCDTLAGLVDNHGTFNLSGGTVDGGGKTQCSLSSQHGTMNISGSPRIGGGVSLIYNYLGTVNVFDSPVFFGENVSCTFSVVAPVTLHTQPAGGEVWRMSGGSMNQNDYNGVIAIPGKSVDLDPERFVSDDIGYLVCKNDDDSLALVKCDHSGHTDSATDTGIGTHTFTCSACMEFVNDDLHRVDPQTNVCKFCQSKMVVVLNDDLYFTELDKALEYWHDGCILTLLDDVTFDAPILIQDKSVTLDLNGHTLDLSAVNQAIRVGEVRDDGSVSGTLTIQDSGEGGVLKADTTAVLVSVGGLNLNGGTVMGTVNVGGSMNMTGGSVTVSSGCAIMVQKDGELTLSGGTLTGTNGLNNLGMVTISGEPVINGLDNGSNWNMYAAIYNSGVLSISGSPVLSGGGSCDIYQNGVAITLNTQPGKTWRVYMPSRLLDDGVFAQPGGDAQLASDWFASDVIGYVVGKTADGSLALVACDHMGNTNKGTDNGDGSTHSVNCSLCFAYVTNDAHRGGVANCVNEKMCEVCDTYYGEVDGSHHKSFNTSTGYCDACGDFVAEARIGDVYYDTFADALEGWSNGTTLVLLDDVVHKETIKILNKSVTLDLNGHTLTMSGHNTFIDVGSIYDSGAMTIRDSGENGTLLIRDREIGVRLRGVLNLESGSVLTGGEYGFITVEGQFNMTGGSVIADTDYEYDMAIRVPRGVANISGGTVVSDTAVFSGGHDPAVNISGSPTIIGSYMAVRAMGGTLTISGNPVLTGGTQGTMYLYNTAKLDTNPGEGQVWTVYMIEANIVANNGVFAIPGEGVELNPDRFACAVIGYIIGQNAEGALTLVKCDHAGNTNEFTFTDTAHSGTCSACNEVVTDEAHWIDPVTGNCMVCHSFVADARIGDVYYDTFGDAMDAWDDGTTLVLLKDVEGFNELIHIVDKSVTLDLNGHRISIDFEDDGRLYNATLVVGDEKGAGGTLTILDSDEDQKGTLYDSCGDYQIYGTLNIVSGNISTMRSILVLIPTGGVVNMSGGIVTSSTTVFMNLGGTVNVSGGTLNGRGILDNSKGTVHITGNPVFNSKNQALRHAQGTMTISGSPVLNCNKENGHMRLEAPVIFNTQAAEGDVWVVYMDKAKIEANNGLFAIPGEGVELNPDRFASALIGYIVEKNADGSLSLVKCDHAGNTNEFTCTDTAHSGTCSACREVVTDEAHWMDSATGSCMVCHSFVADASIGDVYYDTMAEALEAWTDGTTLVLQQPYTFIPQVPDDPATGQVLQISGKSVTLDLNGYLLQADGSPTSVTVDAGAVLTIKDSVGGGRLSLSGNIDIIGTMNLEGGQVELYGSWRILVLTGVFNMSGGAVFSASNFLTAIANGGTVIITGGNVMGMTGISNTVGSASVEISGNPTITGSSAAISSGQGSVTISGSPVLSGGSQGALNVNKPITLNTNPGEGQVWTVYMTAANIEANNGVFANPGDGVVLDAGKFQSIVLGYRVNKNEDGTLSLIQCDHTVNANEFSITDTTHTGTCSACLTELTDVAHSFDPATGYCTVCHNFLAEARIGDVYYDTFADALEGWADSTTLVLVDNVVHKETIKILNKSVTLDLNGKQIDLNEEYVVNGATILIGTEEDPSASLTIQDSGEGGEVLSEYCIMVYGEMNLVSGTIALDHGSELIKVRGTMNMTGGTLHMRNIMAVFLVENRGIFNISGGTVDGGDKTYLALNNLGVMNISGSPRIGGAEHPVRTFRSSTNISGSPVFFGEIMVAQLYANDPVTLNTQPDEGEIWMVLMSAACIADNNGLFAIPGDGVVLDAAKFQSKVLGYRVNKNEDGTLSLIKCDHTVNTNEVTDHGDGTHSFTCSACSTVIEKENHTFDSTMGDCLYCGSHMAEARIGDVYYDTFADALEGWSDGTTLVLLDDVVHRETIKILNKSVTLDLNGRKIDLNEDEVVYAATIMIGTEEDPNASLTILDSGEGGEVLNEYSIMVYGEMNLVSGTITQDYGTQMIEVYGTMNMTGGTLSVTFPAMVCVENRGTVNVSGGTMIGTYSIWNSLIGTVNISGDVTFNTKACGIYNMGGVMNISGNLMVTGENQIAVCILGAPITLHTNPGDGQVWTVLLNNNCFTDYNGLFAIPGDGVDLDAAKFQSVTLGYRVNKNEDGTLSLIKCDHTVNTNEVTDHGDGTHSFTCSACSTVIEKENHTFDSTMGDCLYCGSYMAEARIGDVYYDTFADALEGWADGTTLVLLDNVLHRETIEILNKSVTLDLNGYLLMANASQSIKVDSDATLTLKDGVGGGRLEPYGSTTIIGTMNLEGGQVVTRSNNVCQVIGTLNMSGGSIINAPAFGLVISNYGTVTVTGGTITGESGIGNMSDAASLEISGNPTITGSTDAIYSRKGSVTISGSPVLSGGSQGVLNVSKAITLNTNPGEGQVWTVYMTEADIEANNGLFAIPGEGVDLDAAKFQSVTLGYRVNKNEDGTLSLIKCDHTVNTNEYTITDETHSFTCSACSAVVENEAHFGGIITCRNGKFCDLCEQEYTEKDANAHHPDHSTSICPYCETKFAAKVDDVHYTKFADAFNDWVDGTTLTLLADASSSAVFIENKAVILDLNGYKWSLSYHTSYSSSLIIKETGTLTVRDSFGGGMISTRDYSNPTYLLGTLNLEGGKIYRKVVCDGVLNMTGGTIESPDDSALLVYSENVFISGGTLTGTAAVTVATGGGVEITGSPVLNGSVEAIWTWDSSSFVNIYGTPVLNGGTRGDLNLQKPVTLYTQPAEGETWTVYMSKAKGVFAIPGGGIDLDPDRFTSQMSSYVVQKNAKGRLYLVCDHSGNTNVFVDNGNGTHSVVCSVCNTQLTGDHTYDDNLGACCTSCGKWLFEVDTVEMDLLRSLEIAFIIRNDCIPANTDYILITHVRADGSKVTTKVKMADELEMGDSIAVTYDGLATKEMMDSIHVEIYDANDQLLSNPAAPAYNVWSYISKVLEGDYSDEMKTLAADMAIYGGAAQDYFGYNTGNLISSQLTEAHMAYATKSFTGTVTALTSSGKGYSGTNTALLDKVNLQFAFKKSTIGSKTKDANGNAADFYAVVEIDGKSYETALQEYNSSYWYVPVEMSQLWVMNDMVTVKIYKKTDSVNPIATVTDSTITYASRMLAKNGHDLYRCMMHVAQSAEALNSKQSVIF